jgi:hypothetical protein
MDGMHARHGFWGKEWDLRTEDEAVLMWIARLALLVSSLRGMNKSTEEDEAETPYRAFNILSIWLLLERLPSTVPDPLRGLPPRNARPYPDSHPD